MNWQTLRVAVIALLYATSVAIQAQELDATVSINADKIEASFRERFKTLQQDLQEFIVGQSWTSAQFATQERIQCTFAFTINEMPSSDAYNASLTVQVRRPVYYSNYQTTTFNWKDDQVSFAYTEGQTLNFNEFNLDNELLTVTVYYIYLILGTDFDSFSPNGGEPYFRKAENMVSQMQSGGGAGWKAFEDKKNRHALISALLDESQSAYRQLWYDYHRLGLDAMYQSMDKGRAKVTNGLKMLETIRQADPQSPLLSLFIAIKLDELCNIYSEAPMSEKQQMYTMLQDMFPTYTSQLAPIKKEYKE